MKQRVVLQESGKKLEETKTNFDKVALESHTIIESEMQDSKGVDVNKNTNLHSNLKPEPGVQDTIPPTFQKQNSAIEKKEEADNEMKEAKINVEIQILEKTLNQVKTN